MSRLRLGFSFPSIGSVTALALGGTSFGFLILSLLFFSFFVRDTLAMGMVAMLWSWNFSGVFLPSFSP